MRIHIKRIYDAPDSRDGYRVLVDRLWPRGVSKEHVEVKEWLNQVAPSTELRRWFAHDPARWGEFKRRYTAELKTPEAERAVERLRFLAARSNITLLYAAKDEVHNNAEALREYLLNSRE